MKPYVNLIKIIKIINWLYSIGEININKYNR